MSLGFRELPQRKKHSILLKYIKDYAPNTNLKIHFSVFMPWIELSQVQKLELRPQTVLFIWFLFYFFIDVSDTQLTIVCKLC